MSPRSLPLQGSKEILAQLLATGAAPAVAYMESRVGAEFACSIDQAMNLPGVRERVSYLKTKPANFPPPAVRDPDIDPTKVGPMDVMRLLLKDHALAVQMGQSSAAVRAAELIGKQLGMFIDRQHVDISILDKLDIHEQRALAAALEDLAGESERTAPGSKSTH